jgi:hypothetical protein
MSMPQRCGRQNGFSRAALCSVLDAAFTNLTFKESGISGAV